MVVAGSRHLAVLCPCQRTNLRHLDPVSSGIDGRAAVTSLRPPKKGGALSHARRSPTRWRARGPRRTCCCRASSLAATRGCTTGRDTPTGRSANASGGGAGSRAPATTGAAPPHMARSCTTAACAAGGRPLPPVAGPAPNASPPGASSPTRSLPPEQRPGLARHILASRSVRHRLKLTMPPTIPTCPRPGKVDKLPYRP